VYILDPGYTAIRIFLFKFVWYFQLQVLHKFLLTEKDGLKSLEGQTKAEELGARGLELLSLRLSLKAL
jgi:hypothetical protein